MIYRGPNTAHGRGTASTVPAWVSGKSVHEWFEISGTTHAGSPADPTDVPDAFCRSTKRLSYSNICIADTELVLAASGGHGDYSGNEVTGMQLSVDAPAWALRKARTASVTADAAYNADGTPTSRHLYHSAIYSTTRSRLMLHRTRFVYSSAASFNASNGFNLATNAWDAEATWADGYTPGCKDASDNVWALTNSSGQQLYKWTAATDTWAQTFTSGVAGPSYPMAHDSARSQLFALSWGNGEGGGSGVSAAIYTSGGTARSTISFNASAALTQFEADTPSNASMVYDQDGDRFLFWDGVTGRLFQITPNGTTTWDVSIVTTTGTTPPATEYSFGRLGYIPSLKTIVTMPSGATNLRAMRLA